ncbi:GlpM family protein [Mesorhizobium sp. M0276]|uniref:GlpM family protein n=1 Tax=Mesorhizobium sp. M0276 TaxID=2956928 RepID=UPI0033359ED2
MDVVWKGVVGGLMAALIVWASKRGNILPGILPLAPTFAVIALLAVGARGEPGGFRDACLAGVKTIPAYLAFLGACWLFIDRVDYRLAVAGGIAIWLVAALAIFLAPRYL